jgi:hypothetical protein
LNEAENIKKLLKKKEKIQKLKDELAEARKMNEDAVL